MRKNSRKERTMERFGVLLGLVMMSLVFAIPAWADGVKSYVASYGLDSNPCTLASPCRGICPCVDVINVGED